MLEKIVQPMVIGCAPKTSDRRLIFWARTFCLVKKKNSSDLKKKKKFTVNSKYYREICNILIMFTYLVTSN